MKAVLFDLDETLLDRKTSLENFVSWQANGMLQDELRGKEALFVKRFIELDANGSVWKDAVYKQLVSEFAITHWSWAELLKSYELCFCGFSIEKPGVTQALKELVASGYTLGLISNGKTPFQERNFRALGIAELFSSIIVSDAVGLRKPEPEIFLLACQQLDLTPEQCIFVGDNPVADIAGSNNVGMFSIYIPGFSGPICEDANATCDDFALLQQLIDSVN